VPHGAPGGPGSSSVNLEKAYEELEREIMEIKQKLQNSISQNESQSFDQSAGQRQRGDQQREPYANSGYSRQTAAQGYGARGDLEADNRARAGTQSSKYSQHQNFAASMGRRG